MYTQDNNKKLGSCQPLIESFIELDYANKCSSLHAETATLKKEIQTFVQELREDMVISQKNSEDSTHALNNIEFENFKKLLNDIEHQAHSLITANLLFKDEVRQEIFNNTKEIAIIKEWVASFEQTINGLKNGFDDILKANNNIHKEIVDHKLKDSNDRIKLLSGIVTAAISSIGTLGVLIWGIMELMHKNS